MKRNARGNHGVSSGLRFIRRQMERAPGRGLLALLVAAVLLFGLCYLQESITTNQEEMERLYRMVKVGGRILPKDTGSDASLSGFISYEVPELLQGTGIVQDMVLESAAISAGIYGCSSDGGSNGTEASAFIRGVSDLSQYSPIADGSVVATFLPDWDEETFLQPHSLGGKEDTYGVLVSSTVCEMLEASPGDFVVLDFVGASDTFYICGILTASDTIGALVPISGLDAAYQRFGNEPSYLYTKCDFTIDPAGNFRVNEFRETAETILAKDQKNRENQGLPADEALFVLQDSELTQAIQPLEKNLSLMRLLYPITQAVAALVSAALAMLLLAQRAKDTAILRVLGISRSQTRWMLGVEPVLAALLGAGLGVLVAFLILGRQALGTSCLISLGLYLAGCHLGTILGTVRAVNRKPLELLQVKE